MANLDIPSGPEDVTPDWLDRPLRSTGVIDDASVKSVRLEVPPGAQGFSSTIARFRLEYTNEQERLPRSLVAKFPSADRATRSLNAQLRASEREIGFYEDIDGGYDLKTPRRYYSAIDTGNSVLLLEDLFSARVGDQIRGCSRRQAELALQHLGTFHAAWWSRPRLEELQWLPLWSEFGDLFHERYRECWVTSKACPSNKIPSRAG